MYKYILLLFLIACTPQQSKQITVAQNKQKQQTPIKIHNEINWQKFEPQILIKAKLQKKLIAVYMYSDNCVMCKKMESYTFTDPNVIKIMSQYFINVKINGEEFPEIEAALNEGHVYPSTVLLAPDGTYLIGINGYMQSKQYSSSLMSIINIAKESDVIK